MKPVAVLQAVSLAAWLAACPVDAWQPATAVMVAARRPLSRCRPRPRPRWAAESNDASEEAGAAKDEPVKKKRGRPKGSRTTAEPRKRMSAGARRALTEQTRTLRRPVVVMCIGDLNVDADTEFFHTVRQRAQESFGNDELDFQLQTITMEDLERDYGDDLAGSRKAGAKAPEADGEDLRMLDIPEQEPDREMMQLWLESCVSVTPLAGRRKNKPLEYTDELVQQVTDTIAFQMDAERVTAYPRRADDHEGML